MSPRRAALFERFRSRARSTIESLRVALSGETDDGVWDEVLGGLHTLKGEARMLGRVATAELAHAVEEAVLVARRDPHRTSRVPIGEAIRVLDAMLEGELEESDAVRAEGERGLAVLARGVESGPTGERARSGSATLGRTRRIEVDPSQLDALCDSIDAVRTLVARARVDSSSSEALGELASRVERLGDEASELRLLEVEPVLRALASHAEELAREQGKSLRTLVDAGSASLERSVLEALEEPLLHLVRNAVDHGIESPASRSGKPPTATIRLSASTRNRGVALVVEDDGSGIDRHAVRTAAVARGIVSADVATSLADEDLVDLVFRPGFSSRTTISAISGRGIGLDVVRRVAESLGGGASVTSEGGKGSRFVVDVPVGVARERVLAVCIGGACFGVPNRVVERVVSIESGLRKTAAGVAVDSEHGPIPLRSLAAMLGFECEEKERLALIVEVAERRWALAIGGIEGEHEVLRRPADAALAAFGVASASAVLDDGRPILLPTIGEILRRRSHVTKDVATKRVSLEPTAATRRALVVDDSPIVREIVAELLASNGFVVSTAEDGEAALSTLASKAFDVVVTDLEMPRVDGFELVSRSRERGLSMPIVMVTTRGSAEDRRRATALGANAYVVKTDFREGELVDVVLGLCGGAA